MSLAAVIDLDAVRRAKERAAALGDQEPAAALRVDGELVGWTCCGVLHGDIEAFCSGCHGARPDNVSLEVARRRVARRQERDKGRRTA